MVNSHLVDKSIPLEQVGYVFSLERSIMDYTRLNTGDELLKLIKEADVRFTSSNHKNVIVVDEGEKLAWCLTLKAPMKPMSFYVHTHMSNEHVYLKLHQIINTAESSSELKDYSTIFIAAKRVDFRNTIEQVCETLWTHIQLIEDKHKKSLTCSYKDQMMDSAIDFRTFKEKLSKFIKEEVSNNQV